MPPKRKKNPYGRSQLNIFESAAFQVIQYVFFISKENSAEKVVAQMDGGRRLWTTLLHRFSFRKKMCCCKLLPS